jgi:chromosome segregation ATPase
MGNTTTDQEIQAEVDRLRKDFSGTQDLYREACVLLFFRFGITPTANKLYQFVRKGSMSAPSEALGKFWENLRQKSKVRIEHPDLPDELRDATGVLAFALWNKAQSAAQASLEVFQVQGHEQVAMARAAQSLAETRVQDLTKEHEDARQALERSGQRLREIYGQLEGERATRSALDQRLVAAQVEHVQLHESLQQARRDFSAELERIRATTELAEERLRAAEARALIEIDRERSTAVRLQKELEAARRLAAELEDRNRVEIKLLQGELGQTRQHLGALEGALKQVEGAKLELVAELALLRGQAAESAAHLAVALREKEIVATRALDAEAQVSALASRLSAAAPVEKEAGRAQESNKRRRRSPK